MKLNKRLFFAPCLLILAGQAASLHAANVHWTLSGATFSDGAQLSGSFDFDADASFFNGSVHGAVTNGQFTTTNGSVSSAQTYTETLGFLSGGTTANNYAYSAFFNVDEQDSIGMFFESRPTDAGGTIAVTYAFERRDHEPFGGAQTNVYFVNTTNGAGVITSSSVSGSGGSTGGSDGSGGGGAAPEPGTWLMLGSGVAIAALGRRGSLPARMRRTA